jgi:hypothetical protein
LKVLGDHLRILCLFPKTSQDKIVVFPYIPAFGWKAFLGGAFNVPVGKDCESASYADAEFGSPRGRKPDGIDKKG